MTRRIAGAALFGLGLLCLVAAAALAWLIVPRYRQIPYNLSPPKVVLTAPNATFVDAEASTTGEPPVRVERADLTAKTEVVPDARAAAGLTGELRDHAVIWNVYQTVERADNGDQVNSSESRIALDRRTGAAVAWGGQCFNDQPEQAGQELCTPGNISFAGQLYTFPFGTQKKTYAYYDGAVGAALPISYQGTETLDGVRTYRFEQTIPRQTIGMNAAMRDALLGVFAPKATTGSVYYEATRTVWVEPVTGAIVDYRERHHRELVPDVGNPIILLDATLQYDQATRQAVRAQALDGRRTLLLLSRYVPIGLTVAGILALIFGVLLARAGSRVRSRPEMSDPPAPVPAETQHA